MNERCCHLRVLRVSASAVTYENEREVLTYLKLWDLVTYENKREVRTFLISGTVCLRSSLRKWTRGALLFELWESILGQQPPKMSERCSFSWVWGGYTSAAIYKNEREVLIFSRSGSLYFTTNLRKWTIGAYLLSSRRPSIDHQILILYCKINAFGEIEWSWEVLRRSSRAKYFIVISTHWARSSGRWRPSRDHKTSIFYCKFHALCEIEWCSEALHTSPNVNTSSSNYLQRHRGRCAT